MQSVFLLEARAPARNSLLISMGYKVKRVFVCYNIENVVEQHQGEAE